MARNIYLIGLIVSLGVFGITNQQKTVNFDLLHHVTEKKLENVRKILIKIREFHSTTINLNHQCLKQ